MDDPIVELPENPTMDQVRQAAREAKNRADELQRQTWYWRNLAQKLSDRADEMRDD